MLIEKKMKKKYYPCIFLLILFSAAGYVTQGDDRKEEYDVVWYFLVVRLTIVFIYDLDI